MILSFMGNAYLALKDYNNALVNYNAALANKESLMPELTNNPRFAKESKQDLQSLYNGSVASIYYNASESEIYNQKYNEALNAINQAIALASNITDFNKEKYYDRRGNIYLETNRYDFALTDFNQSIQINKNYAPAYIGRAIAKVSLLQNSKKSNAIVSAKLPNQPFQINWGIKSKSSSQKAEPNLISALEDCNKGIELDKNIGFAYYVRGKIKSFLGYSDYHVDLIKAKELGVKVD